MASRSKSGTTKSASGTGSKRTTSRPYTGKSRPRTAATSTGYGDAEIICAISESRGISPTVGLSFVNLFTSEAVLCQFTDTQTYARTCHKIKVFAPSEILYMSTAEESNLISIIAENLEVDQTDILMTKLDRKYWSEISGHEYVQSLAFAEDLESLKVSVAGNYFATCCFSAALKYIELGISVTFAPQTLRIKFESSEGSMMIDLPTIASLELIQNLQNTKSKDSLFGLLNETCTAMGARFLRSNILQPSTDVEKIQKRQEAVDELASKADTFLAIRSALKGFVDADRVLAALVIIPTKTNLQFTEQSINNVLMLKTFVDSIIPVWQSLAGARSEELQMICQLCNPSNYSHVRDLIKRAVNGDVTYSSKPVELRSQRVYAIQAGINTFLDVARQTYKAINDDVYEMYRGLQAEHEISLDLKFENGRQYYFRCPASDLDDKALPEIFVNVFKRGKHIECQTLELVKMNQKIKDAHNEVLVISDATVQDLITHVRSHMQPLFKISESIATLDMLASFAQLVTTAPNEYVKPELLEGTLAVKAGRHPICEKIHRDKFVPNDVYATRQHRFQIITGCNMSGKSTYIRTIALMAVMAQIGCFVPARYASFPATQQLFARVSTDDNVEANVSTFAAEMREMAFILRNVTPQSLVLVDELGRGTSTADGLAIAIAIAEALIDSHAHVWFVTHFRDLPRILAERAGVANLHLAVDIELPTSTTTTTTQRTSSPSLSSSEATSTSHRTNAAKMTMRYKIAEGYEEERFYGLAFARLAGLPDAAVATATRISETLHERNEARKRNPRATAIARRRKLILNLREQLVQARQRVEGARAEEDEDGENNQDGASNSNERRDIERVRDWLHKLQVEFVVRMKAIEADAEAGVGQGAAAPITANDADGDEDGSENGNYEEENGHEFPIRNGSEEVME